MKSAGYPTLAVQAGGRSSRMGTDKGLVELDGKPLAGHVIDRLSDLAGEVIITTNNPESYARFGCRLVADAEPGAGSLAGLLTALAGAWGDPVLVVACDMPFASRRLAAHMLALIASAEAVVPRPGDAFEPMFAVYRRSCLPAIRRALDGGDRRLISFFDEVLLHVVEADQARSIEPDPYAFFNVNSPADLDAAAQRLRSGP